MQLLHWLPAIIQGDVEGLGNDAVVVSYTAACVHRCCCCCLRTSSLCDHHDVQLYQRLIARLISLARMWREARPSTVASVKEQVDLFLEDFKELSRVVDANPLRPKTHEMLYLHKDMERFGSSIDTSAGALYSVDLGDVARMRELAHVQARGSRRIAC